MSDKDFLQELRDEVKSSTAKMLEETEPSSEPVLEEGTPSQPDANDPTEVDPGFEFVELAPANKPAKVDDNDDGDEVEQEQEQMDVNGSVAGQEPTESTKEVAKLETILRKLHIAQEKLEVKKQECAKLDGLIEGVGGPPRIRRLTDGAGGAQRDNREEDSDDGECSRSSSAKSKASASQIGAAVQKKFDKKAEQLCKKIKRVQGELDQMRLSGTKSSKASTGSTSTLSTVSADKSDTSKKPAKKAKVAKPAKEVPKKPVNKNDFSNIFTKSGPFACAPSTSSNKSSKANSPPHPIQAASASQPTPMSQLNLKENHFSQLTAPIPATLPQFIAQLAKPDNLLLLTLLTLSPKQRDEYLVKIGKERAMLTPAKPPSGKGGSQSAMLDKKAVEINPGLQHFACGLKERAMVQLYGPKARPVSQDEISRPFLSITNAEKIQDVKKVRVQRTFEEEVSYLMNNGKITERQDYKKELTLENTSKAECNGYLTQANKAALAKFVERMLAKGLGYVVEGTLRVNGNNNAQAFVDDHTREADVFINSVILRRCALDGDLVRVFVKHGDAKGGAADSPPDEKDESDESEKGERKRNNWGFVIEILENRHSRLCVGTFMPYYQNSNSYIKFSPRDMKIPVMRIFKQHWPEAIFKNDFKQMESVIYQAEITDWLDDIPVGTILKSIGKCGQLEVENQAILIEYDLDVTPYSEQIINSLPPTPYQIPEEELAKREDLRGECVFTIDPLTARDLDDALSCKILKNGNFEIGVHISDVTYFLQEGSELDELVKLRATSIYMVDNVYHMLPKPLCFLCSLLPGEDKLAFSVFWEITPDAKILKTRFAKTVINSCTQLAYEHAQVMLDNPNGNLKPEDFPQIFHDYSPNYLSRIVNQLQSIAVQLRARRMENGCIKINQPKLSFTLDPASGKPTAFAMYELRTANQMIEDFMLLANSSVAEFTHSKFNDLAVLRSHQAPSSAQMTNLAKMLAKHGHVLRHDSSKAIAESMEAISRSCLSPEAALAALNVLFAKPMTRARYFCSAFATDPKDFYHFALAIPMYTHFTSPIRRYADCMVHRVLTAALGLCDPPARSSEELSQLTEICNVKKYNAKLAGDASSLLYFKHYMQSAKTFSFFTSAAVLDIGAQQIELVLISTGHVIKVSYKQLAKVADFKITEEARPIRHCLIIPKDKKIQPAELRLFSHLRVTVQLVKDVITVTSALPEEGYSVPVTVPKSDEKKTAAAAKPKPSKSK